MNFTKDFRKNILSPYVYKAATVVLRRNGLPRTSKALHDVIGEATSYMQDGKGKYEAFARVSDRRSRKPHWQLRGGFLVPLKSKRRAR